MRNKTMHRLCTLLLALVLVIMPVSGFTPAVHAEDPVDVTLPIPWGVRWASSDTVTWQPPIGASRTYNYSVSLITANDFGGSGEKQHITFIPITKTSYTFADQYLKETDKYYRVEVRVMKPGDAQIRSQPASTNYVSGSLLSGEYSSPRIDEFGEHVTVKINQKITNRISLDIDRSKYSASYLPSFQQARVYGTLPPGMDWGYGEAETPYLTGTPTKLGIYKVDFTVLLNSGQNIRDTVIIHVLPESMENREPIRFIEKGQQMDPVTAQFTFDDVTAVSVIDGALPPGLTIDYNTGKISGTPTKAGKYWAKLEGRNEVTDKFIDYVTFMVTEFSGSYSTTWELKKDTKYDFFLTPHVSGQYETAKLNAGSMPPGMSWKYSEEKGVQITGTPTAAGTYEPMFRIINAIGQWNYETMRITVRGPVNALDLYEVDMSGDTPSMTKAEYEKVLKGTLEAAVKGQQIWSQNKKILGITFTQYDFDGDEKYDFALAPKGNEVLLSQVSGNEKTEDFFLDLNEASIYAAKNGILDYAETVAFRIEVPEIINPFTDFDPELYCYEPILWAYYHNPQITNGLTDTQFGPNEKCTRAQIVTFLWRAAGSPEPSKKTTNFKDVDLGSWYGKAVLWAVEKGITSGVSTTEFKPDGDCTRAQVVTFLFRFGGRLVGDTAAASQFKDIDPGQYYGDAVEWAVKYNITKGTSDNTFGPNESCTRGQIVTFLYRMLHSFNELKPNDFLMYVDDFVSIGDGVYLFQGTITNGSVRFGSRINVQSYDSKFGNSPIGQAAVVSRIQVRKSGRYTDAMQATKGQSVGIYVNSLYLPENVRKGDALIGFFSDIRQVKTNVCGTVTMESAADPSNELREGMKPSIYLGGDINATVSEIYGGELKAGKTGENVLWIDFARPAVFYVGQEVSIRKGSRTCGKLKITKVGP
ncbi:MAG: S-layer homology domain-containing protein [Firmicutes bacterium]|nr:S-layer homology domain-containing protein [Bacillota bacterium]